MNMTHLFRKYIYTNKKQFKTLLLYNGVGCKIYINFMINHELQRKFQGCWGYSKENHLHNGEKKPNSFPQTEIKKHDPYLRS